MKTTKTIIITAEEILEDFVTLSENCTTTEAKEILMKADIYYKIKFSGSVDTGDYKEELKEIKITFEK